MLTLRNKFDALQEKSETHIPNDEYENFVNAHLEAAAEWETMFCVHHFLSRCGYHEIRMKL